MTHMRLDELRHVRQIPREPGYVGPKSSTNWASVVLSHLKICPHGDTLQGIVEDLESHTTKAQEERTKIASEAIEYLEDLGLVVRSGPRFLAKKVRL